MNAELYNLMYYFIYLYKGEEYEIQGLKELNDRDIYKTRVRESGVSSSVVCNQHHGIL